MMVIFLTGLVSMILMRTLRNDYAKYAREDDDLETLKRDVSEESAWLVTIGSVNLWHDPPTPEHEATTALFYSISSTQPGLAGINLGKFLIKSVIYLVRNKREKDKIKTKPDKKREAWRSREKSKAVSVNKGRKTEQNVKRKAENANTIKSYSSFKERRKEKGLNCNLLKGQRGRPELPAN
uniref:Transmembrane 9 superfamily member 1 n=1 Tax=Tanacetum cinerariifolium TaxID=118510 RepID=A0A6L2MVR1_TANCI|nr:transmembrane 9 superfamily member 1 [Tanacetum cinerariifolium]